MPYELCGICKITAFYLIDVTSKSCSAIVWNMRQRDPFFYRSCVKTDTPTYLLETRPGIENTIIYSCGFIVLDFHFGSDIPS